MARHETPGPGEIGGNQNAEQTEIASLRRYNHCHYHGLTAHSHHQNRNLIPSIWNRI